MKSGSPVLNPPSEGKRTLWHPLLTLVLVVALLACYPFMVPFITQVSFLQGVNLNFGITTLILAGLALSWDILGGWTGQNSLGHAALVAVGAYSVTLLAEIGVAPWYGTLIGMGIAGLLAWGWGAMTFRLRGSYFTLSSIAVAEILRLFALNESWLTGGAEGKFMADLPKLFGTFDLFDRKVEFYVALGFVTLVLLFLHWLKTAKLGFYFRAVREDEDGAMALGVNPARAKSTAFIFSAIFTAMGGAIYALYLQALEPDNLMLVAFSIQIALLCIIGGRGTLYGGLVGAILLGVPSEIFRAQLQEANLLVYGILIVLVILYLPKGVMGTLEHWLYRKNHPLEKGGK